VRVHDLSVPGNLSRVSWKLSRTVLRGGTNSNVGPLLGKKTGPKEKQAYNFGVVTGSVFGFAGLWDRWRDPKNMLETCTILTTRPNPLVADVHDRMPAILDPEEYERWLDPGITNSEIALDCLKPFDASLMRKYLVSPRVNRPENDDEECAREVPIIETALTLF
jgi:putative SOS response-associated peptidase YedK